jgi:hypothetical protein
LLALVVVLRIGADVVFLVRWPTEGLTRFEAASNDPCDTKLGPNDFAYTITGVTGERALLVDADGWVRQLDSTLEIQLTGKLAIGDGRQIDIKSVTKLRVERIITDAP